jgi:hypothetical protein
MLVEAKASKQKPRQKLPGFITNPSKKPILILLIILPLQLPELQLPVSL